MDDSKEAWIGKKVFLILKTGRKYSGVVTKCDNDHIYIIDKFNEPLMAAISDISSLEVEK